MRPRWRNCTVTGWWWYFHSLGITLQLLCSIIHLLCFNDINDINPSSFIKTHRSSDLTPLPQGFFFPLTLQSDVFITHLWVAGVLTQRIGLPESLAACVTADVELTEMTSLEVMLVVHSLVKQPITQLTQNGSGRCTNNNIYSKSVNLGSQMTGQDRLAV